MTREEAINSFKKSNEQAKLNIQLHSHIMDTSEIRELEWYIERDKMAIEALEQEPCEDCISREKTLEKFCDYVGSGMSMDDFDALYDIVAKMPRVQPKTEPCEDCLFKKEWEKIGKLISVILEKQTGQEQKSEWIPATCPPKENGKYLVTMRYSTHDFIEIVSYASNLYEVDEYDFADRKRPGWYGYGEYGFFEHDNVVAWKKLPEAYKESEVEGMTFKVIDRKTGKEPTSRVIDNIAKKGGLMLMDIDQFFVGEDGSLALADDCGNITYCDTKRFEVIAEQEPKTEWNLCSEKLPEERDWYFGIFKESDTGWINPLPFVCDYVGHETKATTKEFWILKGYTDRDEHIDYYFNLECVAWMPMAIPKLYNESEG